VFLQNNEKNSIKYYNIVGGGGPSRSIICRFPLFFFRGVLGPNPLEKRRMSVSAGSGKELTHTAQPALLYQRTVFSKIMIQFGRRKDRRHSSATHVSSSYHRCGRALVPNPTTFICMVRFICVHRPLPLSVIGLLSVLTDGDGESRKTGSSQPCLFFPSPECSFTSEELKHHSYTCFQSTCDTT
jgi:hypothetical protein